jgi:4-diphosphocytidyl-2-C-methyl-D-erythritol kinase
VATSVIYHSYAKINLYLDVLNRRRDGYHNIETVFQTVGLCDRLTFTERDSGLHLDCDVPQLANAETNLAYRAAALLQDRTGCDLGAHIYIEKRIPIAAGLAGGSGNAAATLVALNDLWGLELPPAQLQRLALELGSDVPYCMVGGTVAATGRGEVMMPLDPLGEAWFVLLHPPVSVSTPRVYNSPRLRLNASPRFAGRTAGFRDAIYALHRGRLSRAIRNTMEDVVFAGHPSLAEAKARLLAEGCIAAAMSGSGPTLFGVCESRRDGMRVAEGFPEWRSTVVSAVGFGLERG